jgi:hypothetical protein
MKNPFRMIFEFSPTFFVGVIAFLVMATIFKIGFSDQTTIVIAMGFYCGISAMGGVIIHDIFKAVFQSKKGKE